MDPQRLMQLMAMLKGGGAQDIIGQIFGGGGGDMSIADTQNVMPLPAPRPITGAVADPAQRMMADRAARMGSASRGPMPGNVPFSFAGPNPLTKLASAAAGRAPIMNRPTKKAPVQNAARPTTVASALMG